jgi:hypothetical protein
MCLADEFWVVKSFVDSVSLVGTALALFSIWYSRYLAAQDLKKRIDEAQDKTIRRLAAALLQPDVTETGRCLQEAREACRAKRWERAIDRCEQASHRIPRFRFLSGLEESDQSKLDVAVDQLRLLIRQLEEVVARKRTELTPTKLNDLDALIQTLASIEGKIRASGLR